MKTILVIAPHPDDEVLGCGGTIAKYADAGDEVHLCIVTRGYMPDWSNDYLKNKPKEIQKACKILGVKKIHMLNFPTVKLDTIPQKELNDSLLKVGRLIKPSLVFIPHAGDLNKDHRLIFEASLVAFRPTILKVNKILSYEVLSETEWGQGFLPFVPNVFVDISKTLPKKINAIKAYESELKPFPHPRSLKAIEALAAKRGTEASIIAAEAFILVREIN